MFRRLLLLAATTCLASCATKGGIAECGGPGVQPAKIAFPANWNDALVPVPELADFDWSSAEGKNGRYLLDDGRILVDAIPIRPPSPRYPSQAAAEQRDGMCMVKFSVEKDGRSSNIGVACSDPMFASAAQAAATEILFAPATLDGRPVVRNNVLYPVTFCAQP
jgi:TonB family protein